MASVYKRASDKARGKRGVWTMAWIGEDGKPKTRKGFVDKAESQRLADHLEREAAKVRAGLVEPGEMRRREAALRPLADHIADYRADLLAKGDDPKHAGNIASALARLLADASIDSIADIAPDRVQAALGRMRMPRPPKTPGDPERPGKSARTCNHALGALQAFSKWLVRSRRIKESAVAHLAPFPEKNDRRYVRRALTLGELDKLLAATEAGPTKHYREGTRHGPARHTLSGPDRAILYRLAMATGFRANELRSLTPESFNLGESPTITLAAHTSKRGKRSGKDDVQPIARDMAKVFAAWLEARDPAPGQPVLFVPEKTAELLQEDLRAAGIDPGDPRSGVLDFHALRHSYITHLVDSGVNPKIVQELARHSTITLTLDRYTHVDESAKRAALEGGTSGPPSPPMQS